MSEPLDENLSAIVERFNDRAGGYDDMEMHVALADEVVTWVSLDGLTSVLDVATGTGLVLRSLSRRSPGLSLLGIDLSPGMLEVARRELPGADLREGDAAALPWPDDSVDLVTCVTALHLFPDPAQYVAEWARVLRPGGRAVTATFSVLPPRTHGQGHHSPQTHQSHHDDFRTADQVAAVASSAGFSLSRHTTWEFTEDAGRVECVLCELALTSP